MLALDGIPVNLDSMKVEMLLELKDQDMSGHLNELLTSKSLA